MAIFELFSQRQANITNSGKIDVYQYTDIPSKLRNQIKQIAIEGIGYVAITDADCVEMDSNPWWDKIEKIFLRETGLDPFSCDDCAGSRIIDFMNVCNTEEWLDLFDLIIKTIIFIKEDASPTERHKWSITTSTDELIEEINHRLRQADVGYQIEENRLIRIDNQFIHAEVVKPALTLLSGKAYEGPREEFLSAHKHYCAGEYRQAVASAANALESTFKAIFKQKQWSYVKGARISDLAKVARNHHLWPDHLDKNFEQLVASLQNGLPKIRDNIASHGQGAETKHVPSYVATYALHLAATNIVFLTEATKEVTA